MHGNAVASTLRSDAKVVTGAKIDRNTRRSEDREDRPDEQLDVLYLGNDAKIHVDEVKNLTNALRQKLDVTPAQLADVQDRHATEPGDRVVSVVIHPRNDGPTCSGRREGRYRDDEQLIDGGIPLRIAGRSGARRRCGDLGHGAGEGIRGGRPPTPEFFKSISNFPDAQKVLGISL